MPLLAENQMKMCWLVLEIEQLEGLQNLPNFINWLYLKINICWFRLILLNQITYMNLNEIKPYMILFLCSLSGTPMNCKHFYFPVHILFALCMFLSLLFFFSSLSFPHDTNSKAFIFIFNAPN